MSDLEVFVPDTGVLISRLLWNTSVPARALRHALKHYKWVASNETLEELRQVVWRPKFAPYVSDSEVWDFLSFAYQASTLIHSVPPLKACRDPKDDKFLSLAVAAHAKFILTGDRDLLALHPFRGIDILTPRQFLDRPA